MVCCDLGGISELHHFPHPTLPNERVGSTGYTAEWIHTNVGQTLKNYSWNQASRMFGESWGITTESVLISAFFCGALLQAVVWQVQWFPMPRKVEKHPLDRTGNRTRQFQILDVAASIVNLDRMKKPTQIYSFWLMANDFPLCGGGLCGGRRYFTMCQSWHNDADGDGTYDERKTNLCPFGKWLHGPAKDQPAQPEPIESSSERVPIITVKSEKCFVSLRATGYEAWGSFHTLLPWFSMFLHHSILGVQPSASNYLSLSGLTFFPNPT